MPSRQDPFGEMDHITAVPMEQAISEHRETMKRFHAAAERASATRRDHLIAKQDYEKLEKEVQEKTWQLSLSALED